MYTNEEKNAFWRPKFGIWQPFYRCESPKGDLGKNLAWSTDEWQWIQGIKSEEKTFKLLESRNIVHYMFSDHLYIAHISTVCTQQPLSTPLLKAQHHKWLNCTSPSLKYFSVYHNLHLLFFLYIIPITKSESTKCRSYTAFLSKMANQNIRWISKQSKLSPKL